eukprot:scpid86312/ scgid26086/ 
MAFSAHLAFGAALALFCMAACRAQELPKHFEQNDIVCGVGVIRPLLDTPKQTFEEARKLCTHEHGYLLAVHHSICFQPLLKKSNATYAFWTAIPHGNRVYLTNGQTAATTGSRSLHRVACFIEKAEFICQSSMIRRYNMPAMTATAAKQFCERKSLRLPSKMELGCLVNVLKELKSKPRYWTSITEPGTQNVIATTGHTSHYYNPAHKQLGRVVCASEEGIGKCSQNSHCPANYKCVTVGIAGGSCQYAVHYPEHRISVVHVYTKQLNFKSAKRACLRAGLQLPYSGNETRLAAETLLKINPTILGQAWQESTANDDAGMQKVVNTWSQERDEHAIAKISPLICVEREDASQTCRKDTDCSTHGANYVCL